LPLSPQPASDLIATENFSSVVKWPEREANHLLPSNMLELLQVLWGHGVVLGLIVGFQIVL
jgi:hypothetical protein